MTVAGLRRFFGRLAQQPFSMTSCGAAKLQGTYRDLCGFLDLDPWAGTDFEPQRINKTIRIGWLQPGDTGCLRAGTSSARPGGGSS